MADLRTELLAIREKHGHLTPSLAVAEAEADPEGNPTLHGALEWDDAVAGPAYRIVQARELIRSCRITYLPSDDGPVKSIRAWTSVPTTEGRSYEPTEEILANPITRAIVLREMERDWRNLKARYASYEEFWELIAAERARTA